VITIDTPSIILTKKLTAVLNEKLEIGVAMNALAHMSIGMGTVLGPEEALMCNYEDADNVSHTSISAYPFIILKGRPTKIREAIQSAKYNGVIVVDFTNTMTVGSYHEQMVHTKATANSDLEFYGAVFFGEISAVNELTRKFSLFK
jgi:hypothetical protein